MPRAKKKRHHPKTASVQTGDGGVAIGGNVANSNIFTGNNNQVVQQIVEKQLVVSLFTIPAPVGDFTGREKELADLKAAFQSGAIITGVTGGGGIGKTELARKLAQEIAGKYPDARMTIDLLGTSEKPLTSEEAMRRLLEPHYPNQKLPDDPAQLRGLYQETFASKKALLLLDNAANAGQVRPLIPSAPSSVIITSRQYFSLTEFGLQTPLQLPTLSSEKSREFLRNSSAKLLNSEDSNLDQLAYLCGWLPLALRVAVSLLNDRNDWELDILISSLKDERTRLQALKRPDDESLDVEAAIGLSYRMLDSKLQHFFQRVGIFNTPFTNFTAGFVWNSKNYFEIDRMLGRLINLNLINVSDVPFGVDSNGQPVYLYSIHDLTRLFAVLRLLESDDDARETLLLLGDNLLELGNLSEIIYRQDPKAHADALLNFRFLWPHLVMTWEKMLPGSNSWPRPHSADLWLSTFPIKCPDILELCASAELRISVYLSALNASRNQTSLSNDADDSDDVPANFEEDYIQIEFALLNNLGEALSAVGKSQDAIYYLETALIKLDEGGKKLSRGNSLLYEKIIGNMGNAYFAQKDYKKALELYDKQLNYALNIGDVEGVLVAIGNKGNALFKLEDFNNAMGQYRDQLSLARDRGNRQAEGDALGNMGTTVAVMGQPTKAVELLIQAIDIAHEMGDGRREAIRLSSLGLRYADLKDYSKALEILENGLLIARATGYRNIEADTLINMSGIYKKLGEKGKARELLEQALELYQSLNDSDVTKVKNWLRDLEEDEASNKLYEFIHTSILAARNKSPNIESYYETTTRMSSDSTLPLEIQNLAKVLRNVLVGVKRPDLSSLPEELAKVVNEELEK